jgi:hypothetical protein
MLCIHLISYIKAHNTALYGPVFKKTKRGEFDLRFKPQQ